MKRTIAQQAHPVYGTVEVYVEGKKVIGMVSDIDKKEAMKKTSTKKKKEA